MRISKTLVYPKVNYFLLSEKKDNYYCITVNRIQKHNQNRLVINKYINLESCGGYPYDGSNIEIGPSNIIVDNCIYYKFSELCIGVVDNKCYLVTQHSLNILWRLPTYVGDFLEIKEFRDGPIALTIKDNKPFILKIKYRITLPIEEHVDWFNEIMLYDNLNVKFVSRGENLKERLLNSYFIKDNIKYYIKDCIISKKYGTYTVCTDMKSKTGEVYKYVSISLGYIENFKQK